MHWPRVRNLLWKELREQRSVTPVVVVVVMLVWHSAAPVPPRFIEPLWEGTLFFTASILGALFFAGEAAGGGRGFLLRLPISPAVLLGSKLAAGLLQLVAATIVMAGLVPSVIDHALPLTAAPRWPGLIATAVSLYLVCALLSLLLEDPLKALLGGILASVLLVTSGFSDSYGTGVLWPWPVLLLVSISAFWGLVQGIQRLEDRPATRRFGLETLPRLPGLPAAAGALLWSEWRQKWWLVVVLILGPTIVLLPMDLTWNPATVSFLKLWMILAGSLLGTQLFTSPERTGPDFFLYHLPLRREHLVARGLASAALVLTIILVEIEVAGSGGDLRQVGTSSWIVLPALWIFLVSFGLGATVSPWTTRPLSGVVLTMTTASLTLWLASVDLGLGIAGSLQSALCLLLILNIAFWSTIRSRALEHRSGKATFKVLTLRQ